MMPNPPATNLVPPLSAPESPLNKSKPKEVNLRNPCERE